MGTTQKRAIVIGATGLVGSCLVRRLLADESYGQVTTVTRRPLADQHPKLRQVVINLDQLEEADTAIGEAEDWFCTLGTTIKQAGSQDAFRRVDHDYPLAFARLARKSAVTERFLIVTAMGARADSRVFYSRVKGETERDLAALKLPSLVFFRPSLLLGERAEFRSGERIGAFVMKAAAPLLVGPLRRYRAVSADRVAAAMIAAAQDEEAASLSLVLYENDRILAGAAGGQY